MAEDSYRFSSFWGAREESAVDIATRLFSCLTRLKQVHPFFADWRDGWENEEEWLAGLKPSWPIEIEALAALVGGRKVEETADDPSPLGFIVSGWTGPRNGDEDASASLVLQAGKHANRMAPNSFAVELPSPFIVPDLYDTGIIEGVMEVVVESWQPWWANFANSDLLAAQHSQRPLHLDIDALQRYRNDPAIGEPTMPTVGWLTYLENDHFNDVPSLDLPRVAELAVGATGAQLRLGCDPLHVAERDALAVLAILKRPFDPHEKAE